MTESAGGAGRRSHSEEVADLLLILDTAKINNLSPSEALSDLLIHADQHHLTVSRSFLIHLLKTNYTNGHEPDLMQTQTHVTFNRDHPLDDLSDVTDLTLALILAQDCSMRVKYCPQIPTWYFDWGGRWVKDESGQIDREALHMAQVRQQQIRLRTGHVFGEMQDNKDAAAVKRLESELKRLHRAETVLGSNAKVVSIVQTARTLPAFVRDFDQWDTNPWLLNFKNCTYNLLTHDHTLHCRENFITKQCPINFDPEARGYYWDAFLRRVLPGEQIREFMQRWLGYCLTGSVANESFVLLYGTGQNGKSVLLNAIAAALGDYARSVDLTLFMANQKDNPAYHLAMLPGVRFVYAIEVQSSEEQINAGLIKKVASRDPIQARPIYGKPIEFDPECKITLAMNHLPPVNDQTKGMWRRINMIPMTTQIPDSERDETLIDKLTMFELPVIMNWLLEGLKRYQMLGLSRPEAVQQATMDYQIESDPLYDMIRMYFDVNTDDPEYTVVAHEAYEVYLAHCHYHGVPQREIQSEAWFGRRMKERYKWNRTAEGVLYLGVRLRRPAAETVEHYESQIRARNIFRN